MPLVNVGVDHHSQRNMSYSAKVLDHYENPRNVGKLDEAHTIKNSAIAEELALPPVKIHCRVLAEDAIKSAIADYRNKQE